jgi:hypothetical protein
MFCPNCGHDIPNAMTVTMDPIRNTAGAAAAPPLPVIINTAAGNYPQAQASTVNTTGAMPFGYIRWP